MHIVCIYVYMYSLFLGLICESASVTSSRSAGPLAWLPELTGTRCPGRQEKIDDNCI